jgi:Lrp/AsnC family transcriptional regulator, leucine-responsive regulatory protein
MNRVDLGLLAALEKDGRASFAALGESAGLSKTACWSRVQALEDRGVIRGYSAQLDAAALGLALTAYVSVMIDFAQRDAFESAVLENPTVVECATIAGEGDYLLKIVCADVGQLDELLRYGISLLPGVQRSSTTISLKTIKRAGSLVEAIAAAGR